MSLATEVPRSLETAPPPQDRHRALRICLLKGPRGWRFLMSEVPLYSRTLGQCVSSISSNSGIRTRHSPPSGHADVLVDIPQFFGL